MELNFNAQNVKPQEANFEPVPNAWYQGIVEKAELKPTKAAGGSYISLMCGIQGPEHAGRKIFGNLNVTNSNAQAQEIGQAQLSALCHAIGVLQLNNTEQLVGIPMEFRTKITPAQYNVKGDPSSGILYEARNEIAAFRAVGAGTTGAATAPGAKPATPTAPARPATPAAPVARPAAPTVAPVAQEASPAVDVQATSVAQQDAPQATVDAAGNPVQPW
jgi:hypothetical protein